MSCVAGEGGPTGWLHNISWVCASSSLSVLQPVGLHCTIETAAPASCGSRMQAPAACRGADVPWQSAAVHSQGRRFLFGQGVWVGC